jgi:hypothetical protein
MRLRLLPFVALLSLAACTGPAGPAGPVGPEEEPPVPPEEEPAYPSYETFDPAPYDAQPPLSMPPPPHDVPDRLMEGRVEVPNASRERQVEGYRIQVFTSDSRESAERVRAEVLDWWPAVRGTPGAPADLETAIAYIQPYYRVRVGAFETRDEAEAALGVVRQQYTEAFIVPDLVTIRD